MMKHDLNKMYEFFIDFEEVSTAQLKEVGIYGQYLSKLVESNILKRVRRGVYQLDHIDGFIQYGFDLKNQENYDRCYQCFSRCYEINPKDLQVCFELFFRYVSIGQYEKSFVFFKKLYKVYHKIQPEDYNLYFVLFSQIIDFPCEYQEYVLDACNQVFLKRESTELSEAYRGKQNLIRRYILNQYYPLASVHIREILHKQEGNTTSNLILQYLVEGAFAVQKKERAVLLQYIQEEDYKQAISYLYGLSQRSYLGNYNSCCLTVLKDFNKFQKYNVVPVAHSDSASTIFEAVKAHNYPLAWELNSIRLKKYPSDANTNSFTILLSKFEKLFVQNRDQIDSVTVIEKDEIHSDFLEENTKQIVCEEKTPYTSVDFLNCLMNEDFENASYILHCYLEQIEKSQYEAFIIDLVNLSWMQADTAFVHPMSVLSRVHKETYQFDLSFYVDHFYEALSTDRLGEAEIYLDILRKSRDLGQECLFVERLEQVLFAYKQNTYEEVAEENVCDDTVVFDNQNCSASEILMEESEDSTILKTSSFISKISEPIYDESKLICKKLEQLKQDGIVLLKSMSHERVERILKAAESIDHVSAFAINSNKKQRVVLCYREVFEEEIDKSILKDEGKKAYQKQDYITCIQIYRKILASVDAYSYVYARLGLAYMKLGMNDLAADYLLVATELNKSEPISLFDFYQIIDFLKGRVADDENRKPRFRMNLSDFEEQDEYYGLEHVEEIVNMMNLESDVGITFNDACDLFGFDYEQRNLLYLVFAKSCYAQGNLVLGNQYLKLVEEMKDKTTQIKKLLREIQKNKKFYQYRNSEKLSSLQLVKKY